MNNAYIALRYPKSCITPDSGRRIAPMNTPDKPKIGLLPLMLELYKTYSPELEERQQPFIRNVFDKLGRFSFVLEEKGCTVSSPK